MRTLPAIIGGLGLTIALAGPSFAQQVAATTDQAPAVTSNQTESGPNGSLQRYHGAFRASKLVGSNVYNQSGQTVGSVDDLLIGEDGKISQAVVSVGGFLGIGGKLVAVPFNEFKFVESRKSTTADSAVAPMEPTTATVNTPPANATLPAKTSAAAAEPVYFSVVLPSATKSSLSSAAEFKYAG